MSGFTVTWLQWLNLGHNRWFCSGPNHPDYRHGDVPDAPDAQDIRTLRRQIDVVAKNIVRRRYQYLKLPKTRFECSLSSSRRYHQLSSQDAPDDDGEFQNESSYVYQNHSSLPARLLVFVSVLKIRFIDFSFFAEYWPGSWTTASVMVKIPSLVRVWLGINLFWT